MATVGRLAQALRLRQFVKFCLVGGSGVVVDMTILHCLVRWCGWNVSLSKLCSAEAALLNNFLWNEVWTFRAVIVPRQASGNENAWATPHLALSSSEEERVTEGRASSSPLERKHGSAGASPRRVGGVVARLLRFHAICGAGIGLAVFCLHVFYRWLGFNLYAANFLAILLVTLWNFGLNARFNWNLPKGG